MKNVFANSISLIERAGRNLYLFDIKNWEKEENKFVTKDKRFTAVRKDGKWRISDSVTGKKSNEKSIEDCMKFAIYCCDLMENL